VVKAIGDLRVAPNRDGDEVVRAIEQVMVVFAKTLAAT
jgi:hypothetical protein